MESETGEKKKNQNKPKEEKRGGKGGMVECGKTEQGKESSDKREGTTV